MVDPILLAAARHGAQAPVGAPGLHGVGTDSVVVKNPVPGGLGYVLNVLFNLPQWAHLVLVLVGATAGAAAAWVLWTRRERLWQWLVARDRRAKLALGGIAGIAVLAGAGGGLYGWNYMQHENDFCLGCHVMTPAWEKFSRSEHAKLQCHDCHRQSQYANARQLVLWIAERPKEIPPHAKVPTRICAECHVRKPPQDSVWKRIVATGGHRVHLASNDTALKGVQCVTCHGVEVHAFQPVDKTCGQAGCHTDTKAKIVLGKMAGQTTLHCTGCHAFTRPVAENVSVDSTKKLLVPGATQCLGCHAMQTKMKGFDPSQDAHAGLCGSCHDPHKDKTPQASWATCATAGCHADAKKASTFHVGIPAATLARCEGCHKAHTWKSDGNSCTTCHRGDIPDGPRAAPARTARVSTAPAPPPGVGVLAAPAPPRDGWMFLPAAFARAGAVPHRQVPDRRPRTAPGGAQASRVSGLEGKRPFRHKSHRNLTCQSCHDSAERHGGLTVTTAADCASCHHAKDRAIGCEGCHQRKSLALPITVTREVKLTVWKAPKVKAQGFRHTQHRDVECATCHTKGLDLAVSKDCQDCHVEHHDAARDCRSCHVGMKDLHARSVHQGCAASGCHTAAGSDAVPTARNVCLACHADLQNHKRGGECGDCHRMATWSPTAGTGRGS